MFDIFTKDNTMLDIQFFMMKYGVFIIAGILGCIGSVLYNNTHKTIKDFIKHLTMTIILSIVAGILLSNFWAISLEVCFAIVIMIAFFSKKVIIELNEIIDNVSDLVLSFIRNKFNVKKEKGNDQVDKDQNYNEN
jgi:hypothetical protein